jgi:hypothetical protein
MTVSQVEAKSLAAISQNPDVPQVPFGHANGMWKSVKALVQPGDTIHEFRTDITSGHFVMRRGCVIAQFPTSIR